MSVAFVAHLFNCPPPPPQKKDARVRPSPWAVTQLTKRRTIWIVLAHGTIGPAPAFEVQASAAREFEWLGGAACVFVLNVCLCFLKAYSVFVEYQVGWISRQIEGN